mmetsp:Transcript_9252/g.25170  ORF Transcript_9252/g.25170 Transcript_9252/m.25170 type:complete len:107 (-) Transcript_9252:195-515(-)
MSSPKPSCQAFPTSSTSTASTSTTSRSICSRKTLTFPTLTELELDTSVDERERSVHSCQYGRGLPCCSSSGSSSGNNNGSSSSASSKKVVVRVMGEEQVRSRCALA